MAKKKSVKPVKTTRSTQVKMATCPQNQVSSDNPEVIVVSGCTEAEARSKVYRQLVIKAKQLRIDKNVGSCDGATCGDGGVCTLITPIADGELNVYPGEVKGCNGGGFVAVFIGKVRAECICAM